MLWNYVSFGKHNNRFDRFCPFAITLAIGFALLLGYAPYRLLRLCHVFAIDTLSLRHKCKFFP